MVRFISPEVGSLKLKNEELQAQSKTYKVPYKKSVYLDPN